MTIFANPGSVNQELAVGAYTLLAGWYDPASGARLSATDAAGTGNWHEGEDANAKTVKVLRESGYEIAHTARQFKKQWFEERDLILVMDQDNLKNMLAIAPKEHAHKIQLMKKFDPKLKDLNDDDEDLIVPDPYHQPIDDFYEVLDMLEKAADGLVTLLKK